MTLDACGIVVQETEVERGQRGHRARGADERLDARARYLPRQLARELRVHLAPQRRISLGIDRTRKREPLGERHHAESQADGIEQRAVASEDVFRRATTAI